MPQAAGTAAVALATCLLASSASAATIGVHPDRPNAIQRAVNRADPGDTLRVHEGRYPEDVAIDKRLTVKGVADERRPVIDGGCEAETAIDVLHRGVQLRGLRVVGAAHEYNVNIVNQATATLSDLVVKETCDGANAALYGINVFDGGAIEIRGSRTFGGFTDAGIYVGGITDTSAGPLLVVGNESYRNNRGIIVEDSFGVRMRVRDNLARNNVAAGIGPPTGIFSRNSDGIRYIDNRVRDNGTYGIHLDSNSDNNALNGNVAIDNPTNFFDEGTGNCGAGNSGFPIDPC